MPRVLTCLDDPAPSDGTCTSSAYIEQASIADFFPTHEQANAIGVAFFGALILVAFAVRTFKPQR